MKNTMKTMSLLAVLLSLGGCSTANLLTSTAPVQTIYALRPAPAIGAEEAGTARVVEVTKPSVPPGFETDRIALYLDGGQKLDYFSGAQWPSLLDEVVQEFTRRTATNTLPFVVAVTPSQSLDADFRLQVKVNEFQPVYDGGIEAAPRLVTNLEFTLISMPEERIVRSFSLGRQGTASSNRLDVIAAGLEKMLQEVEVEAFQKLEPHLRPQKR